MISNFNNIDNLLTLQNKSNIKLFKKNNTKLILRDIIKIIDDCNKMKKKKLLELSNNLKTISHGNIELIKIKQLHDTIYNELNDIEQIINIINNINNYIETYEN